MTYDLSLQQILLRIVTMLIIGTIQGGVLVAMVSYFGDRGPRYDGRLSPNPLVQADPLGIVFAVCTLGGWIRQLPLDPGQLRQGRLALVLSALASLLAVVLVGLALLQLRGLAVAHLPASTSNLINIELKLLAQMSVVYAIINLIPLPPFAGGYLLQAAAPRLHAAIAPRTTIIAVVLVGLALIDRGAVVRAVLDPLVRALTGV